tara:strand:- start:793 stop:1239 length:447 start_codon:yes stop_codon:yes gene_type:complete
MRHFEIQVDITAPKEKVWEVLVDFDNYVDWNPTITKVTGNFEAGGTITFKFRKAPRPTDAYVESIDEGRMFVFSRCLLLPSLIHMVHDFELQVLEHGETRLIQRWHCRGLLVPLIWKKLTSGMKTFNKFNGALKSYVENKTHESVRSV